MGTALMTIRSLRKVLWPIAALAMLLFAGMAGAGTTSASAEDQPEQQSDERSDLDASDDGADADADADADSEAVVEAEADTDADVDADVNAASDSSEADISITVSADCMTVVAGSDKDISNVFVRFMDGTTRKIDGVNSLNFEMTFDKAVASATAKSGTSLATDDTCDTTDVDGITDDDDRPTGHVEAPADDEGTRPDQSPEAQPGPEGEPVEDEPEVLGVTIERPASQPATDDQQDEAAAPDAEVAPENRAAPDETVRNQHADSLPRTGAPLGALALGAVTALATGATILRRKS